MSLFSLTRAAAQRAIIVGTSAALLAACGGGGGSGSSPLPGIPGAGPTSPPSNSTTQASIVQGPASSKTTTAVTSLAVTLTQPPSTGDLLIASVSSRASGALSAPSGWTQIGSTISAGTDRNMAVFQHVVAAGDGTSFTFGTSSASAMQVAMYEVSGQDDSPIDGTGTASATGAGGLVTSSSATPTSTNDLGLAFFAQTYSSSPDPSVQAVATGWKDDGIVVAQDTSAMDPQRMTTVGSTNPTLASATFSISGEDRVGYMVLLRGKHHGGGGSGATPAPAPAPTSNPTQAPTSSPTQAPTASPTQAPTTSPTAPPIPVSGANSGYTVAGCPMFPGTAGGSSGGWFNTDVYNAPTDPNSAAYIQAYTDVNTSGFNVWTSAPEYVNVVSGNTPQYNITSSNYPGQTNYTPWAMPWGTQTGGSTTQLEASNGGDGHYQVLTVSNGSLPQCGLWESGHTAFSGSSFSVYWSGHWDTTLPFSPSLQGGATADAPGIPLTAIEIRPEELAAGAIHHALGWSPVGCEGTGMPFDPNTFVAPAAEGSGCAKYSGPAGDTPMPYGSHIRLKASFNDSGWSGASRTIAEALKHYGAYMYDTGCCNLLLTARDQYGTISQYFTQTDSNNIGTLNLSDFDVISPSNSNAPN